MRVRDGMTEISLTVGPGHTLREAARKMTERGVGSAIVEDPDGAGPGILTERDVLRALGKGCDPDREVVNDHMSDDLIFASPDWDLDRAAERMIHCNFRHLLVMNGGEILGIISMRDIVRCWAEVSVTDRAAVS